MSLEDRILDCKNDIDECGDDQDYMECAAYNAGLERAAILAVEADELIDWLKSDIEILRKLADSASSFGIAQRAIDRIEIWKEQTNDQ